LIGATDLMTTLAKIQNATGAKRTALIADARAKLGKVVWSNDEMARWAKAAFQTGIKQ
jgi:hypothetical protein